MITICINEKIIYIIFTYGATTTEEIIKRP